MSTISVNVAFGAVTKKVSCLRGSTTGQLLNQAIEKHGLSQRVGPGTKAEGQLLHNNKVVDSSLPLRLTSIGTNSKLSLQIVPALNQTLTVRVKLLVSIPELSAQTSLLIAEIPLDISISEMIDRFSNSADPSPFIGDRRLQVIIANTTYLDLTYQNYTLRNLIGSLTSSIVIRMNYLRSEKDLLERNQEQQSIVGLELQHQLRRKQEQAYQEEQAIEAERLAACDQCRNTDSPDSDDRNLDKSILRPSQDLQTRLVDTTLLSKESADASLVDVQQLESDGPRQHHEEKAEEEKQSAVGDNAKTTSSATAQESRENAVRTDIGLTHAPVPEMPRIFVPSSTIGDEIYENPQLDYTMTVAQAKAYHMSILERAKPKRKTPAEVKSVLSYQIRVKFPDRTMIQIGFNDHVDQVRFGQVIKKIDELLAPQYVGNYILKYGFPPFKTLAVSFDLNGTLLRDIEEFKQGQVVLVWEPIHAGSVPPYVNTDGNKAVVMPATELPQMLVEKERPQMAEDDSKISVTTVDSILEGDGPKHAEKPVKKGVPKWLHLR